MRNIFVTSIALIVAGCGGDSDSAQITKSPGKQLPPISDAALAELVPDFVDAQSMTWLAGNWGVLNGSNYAGTTCKDGGAISLKTDGYVFDVNSDPEPDKTDKSKTSGSVNVSKGQNPGSFNLTPPQWKDAYFRIKPRSKDRLSAQLWTFSKEKTEWMKTHEFEFERCGS